MIPFEYLHKSLNISINLLFAFQYLLESISLSPSVRPPSVRPSSVRPSVRPSVRLRQNLLFYQRFFLIICQNGQHDSWADIYPFLLDFFLLSFLPFIRSSLYPSIRSSTSLSVQLPVSLLEMRAVLGAPISSEAVRLINIASLIRVMSVGLGQDEVCSVY